MSQLSKLITRKYMVAIIVIAILDTISFTAVLSVINLDKDYAFLINTSGRQRMLSQRIALHLNQLQHADQTHHDQIKNEALSDIGQFEKSNLILSDQYPKVSHTIAQKIIDFYRREGGLDSESRYFVSRARQLLSEQESSEELIKFTSFASS